MINVVKPPSIADVCVPMLFRGITFLATSRIIMSYEMITPVNNKYGNEYSVQSGLSAKYFPAHNFTTLLGCGYLYCHFLTHNFVIPRI